MRLLFMNQYFPPDTAATAHLLGELCEDLAPRHEVWVLAGRPSYAPGSAAPPPPGISIERVRSTAFSRNRMLGRLINYATFLFGSLLRGFRVPRPDVVIGFTDPPLAGLVALLVSRYHRARFVYVCWDIYPDMTIALGKMDNPLIVSLWRWLNRPVRNGASRVVAIGRDMQEKLIAEGLPGDKVVFIPNWANDVTLEPSAIAAIRTSMGWDGKFVVMHGGNIGLFQGLEFLADTAVKLRSRSDVLIAVVGDGVSRPGLERMAREKGLSNLVFVPYRPRHEAQAILASADLHLVSLIPRMWGNAVPSKIYGILALGKPFVAAVEPGSEIDRIIIDSEAGVRIDPGDSEALAKCVLDFADGPQDVGAVGEKARREFVEKYTRELSTKRYQKMLE